MNSLNMPLFEEWLAPLIGFLLIVNVETILYYSVAFSVAALIEFSCY